MNDAPILTERLELPVLRLEMLDAIAAKDAARLCALLDVADVTGLIQQQDFVEIVPLVRNEVSANPDAAAWWGRAIVRRDTRAAIGTLGFGGPPDADGVVVMGYGIDPLHQRRGYASEAVAALVAWSFGQPGVAIVRATIPPRNEPSRRVAAHAGLTPVGQGHDDEVGEVEIWERATDLDGETERSPTIDGDIATVSAPSE